MVQSKIWRTKDMRAVERIVAVVVEEEVMMKDVLKENIVK
jgi:hypothetical protein